MGLSIGETCTACTPGHCRNKPTEEHPRIVPLGRGREIVLTDCPNQFCGENARRVVRAARFAELGILPVAGGWLNQSQPFLDALEYALATRAELKAEMHPRNPHA